MPRETEEARDERKRAFIESLKASKCRSLIAPLADKVQMYEKGEIAAEDIFRAAHYVAKQGDEIVAMFKKRPDVILAGIAMEDNLYVTGIGDINIKVRRGDLTVLFVDAIVNPASPDGSMDSGVAGAIARAGGDTIEKEARAKAPIEQGTAVVTSAGSLPNLYVLHAPTATEKGGKSSTDMVKGAVLAALGAARELELASLAIPGLGTGAGGIAPLDAGDAIIDAIRSGDAGTISDIILIDTEEEIVQGFITALERYDEESGS